MTEQHWTLDKKVPIALIVVLAVQFFGGVWFMSKLDSRVATLEDNSRSTAPQADRLTRVEVKIEGIQSGVERIERLIRRDP